MESLQAIQPVWQPELESIGQQIANSLSDRGVTYYSTGAKSEESILEKFERVGSVADIRDAVRITIIVDRPTDGDAAVELLGAYYPVSDGGWSRNRQGFADRKVYVTFADGTVGEVLIMPRAYSRVAEQSHELYEEFRNLPKNDPGRLELEAQARALHDRAQQEATTYDPAWDAVFGGSR